MTTHTHDNTIEELLAQHNIKPTANRIIVAKALSESRRPLSMSELEEIISSIDKSNIFRTLTLFNEHHLVHAIESGADGTRFELCHSCNHNSDDDLHAHFYCEQCHRTYCLDTQIVPPSTMPDGFNIDTINYVIKGQCPSCSNSMKPNAKTNTRK